MSPRRLAAALIALLALTCFLTWPQAIRIPTHVANHDDPFFSTWRLAWIAHALRTDPGQLYNGNIFHPDTGTLANSDAVILQGALAAPLFWAGLGPVAIYNLTLLGGIFLSGVAMLVLARRLTGDDGAALVAAAVFMMVPYRIAHFEHLELQWTCFVPLAFWAVHRAFDERSPWYGMLAGVFVWLQLTASIYYGVFLGIVISALAALLLVTTAGPRFRALAGLLAGGVIAAGLTLVYARPYMASAARLGMRRVEDIELFSASGLSYLSAPAENWLWGWTSRAASQGDELHLFPGGVAIALAVVGLFRAPRATAIVYALLLALIVELSFGFNGWLYPWLHRHVFVLQGLRATARISLLGFCILALLSGFGWRALKARATPAARRWTLTAACLLVVSVEYGAAPITLLRLSDEVPPVYQLLRRLPRGPVAEFPMPKLLQGSAYDPLYMFSSIGHWFPLINGYSGFIPAHYHTTMDLVEDFPGETSIQRLRQIGTRYLIVHEQGYLPDEYLEILLALRSRPDVVPFGRYGDLDGRRAELFELRPDVAAAEREPPSKTFR